MAESILALVRIWLTVWVYTILSNLHLLSKLGCPLLLIPLFGFMSAVVIIWLANCSAPRLSYFYRTTSLSLIFSFYRFRGRILFWEFNGSNKLVGFAWSFCNDDGVFLEGPISALTLWFSCFPWINILASISSHHPGGLCSYPLWVVFSATISSRRRNWISSNTSCPHTAGAITIF